MNNDNVQNMHDLFEFEEACVTRIIVGSIPNKYIKDQSDVSHEYKLQEVANQITKCSRNDCNL